jgi:hypothetical protein
MLVSLSRRLQRPRLRRLRHRQRPHEVAKVVRQGAKLKANSVGGEGAARQAGTLDRALAFLDELRAVRQERRRRIAPPSSIASRATGQMSMISTVA